MVRKWVGLIFGLLAFVLIGVVMAFFNPSYGASCRPPDPAAQPVVRMNAGELRTLAALAWGEARGENNPYCSMLAVSAVVINRLQRNPKTFGATITQVINKPQQFSVFGKTDPNLRKMARVDESDPLFLTAILAALSAVSGNDPSEGATHFHAGRTPRWAAGMLVTARIGNHTFRRGRD